VARSTPSSTPTCTTEGRWRSTSFQKIEARAFSRLGRDWVATYRGRSPSTDDFIRLASRVAHKDPRTFLVAWLYGTRTPPMPGHPDWTVDPVPARPAAAMLHRLSR